MELNKKKKIWSKGIYKKKMLAEKNANMNNHSQYVCT